MPISLKEYTAKYGLSNRKKAYDSTMKKKKEDANNRTSALLSQANAVKTELDKYGKEPLFNKETFDDTYKRRQDLKNSLGGFMGKAGLTSLFSGLPSFSGYAAATKEGVDTTTSDYNASIAEGEALSQEAVLAEQQRLKKLKSGLAGNITSR